MPGKIRHGHAKNANPSRTYNSWISMIRRCTKPNRPEWKYYGGRGITVCETWMKFDNFLLDMGDRPPGTTLERRNNELGYDPSNCRWASMAEQSFNKRSNRIFTVNGIEFSAKELSEIFHIHINTVWSRLHRGWSAEDAFCVALIQPRH